MEEGPCDRDLQRQRERVRQEEVEGDVASVAALIKLRAAGRAGSRVSLKSVCSVGSGSVVLACGLLLSRGPTRPVLAVFLPSFVVESEACQQDDTTADPRCAP